MGLLLGAESRRMSQRENPVQNLAPSSITRFSGEGGEQQQRLWFLNRKNHLYSLIFDFNTKHAQVVPYISFVKDADKNMYRGGGIQLKHCTHADATSVTQNSMEPITI